MDSFDGRAYAVVKDSGQQFRVSEGDRILVDRRDHVSPGDSIVFEDVLLLRGSEGVRVGTPTVDGAKVEGKVLEETLGPKLVVFKFKRRKNSRKKTGHRQKYTLVEVKKIQA